MEQSGAVFEASSDGRAFSSDVTVREVALREVRGADWDAFAAACGCSVRATRGHLVAWNLKNFRYRLRMFEVFADGPDGAPLKIGQCAVGRAGDEAVILDRLQLLPLAAGAFSAAMAAILRQAGAGAYEYGWELNLERAREADLAALPGVTVEITTPLVVQAIDFSQWDNWEAYHRGMRKGARQSAQFAFRDIPDLSFVTWTGRQSILAIGALLRLRVSLSKRKHLGLRVKDLITSYLGWMILCPDHTVTSLAVRRQII